MAVASKPACSNGSRCFESGQLESAAWINLRSAPTHCGLCILDFEHGQLLQLSGRAALLWNRDDPDRESGDTGRYWEFRVEQWILRDTAQALEWEYLDASPFNPS